MQEHRFFAERMLALLLPLISHIPLSDYKEGPRVKLFQAIVRFYPQTPLDSHNSIHNYSMYADMPYFPLSGLLLQTFPLPVHTLLLVQSKCLLPYHICIPYIRTAVPVPVFRRYHFQTHHTRIPFGFRSPAQKDE